MEEGLQLSKERKITGADTCFLVMWNMQRRKYRMVITADKMVQPTRRAFLEDSYNRTSTPILLQGNTEYDFLVTTDPALLHRIVSGSFSARAANPSLR